MKRRPYRKILLAVDGSENAENAAVQGLKLQKVHGLGSMQYMLPAFPAVLLSCPRVATGK